MMFSPRAARYLVPALSLVVFLQGILLYSQTAVLEDMVGRRHLTHFLLHGSGKPLEMELQPLTPTQAADEEFPPVLQNNKEGNRHEMEEPLPPPEPQDSPETIYNASFCNASVTLYTSDSDARCIAYLSDADNIASIAPMASIMALARTIKFKVKYRLNNIRAIAKVSQNNFPFEPHSELLGFRIDRLLGMNKIPPTAWVQVPVSALKDSLAVITDHSFHEWVERDVFQYPDVVQQMMNVEGVPHMQISMQLWMNDVHPLQDTEWALDKHWQPYFYPSTPLRTNDALPHLSDITVLDYILANPDRRLDKNTYVAGGCVRNCERRKWERPHIGPISLVPIDQGSSFYSNVPPDINPLKPPGNDFCRFRRSTLEKLKSMRGNGSGHGHLYSSVKKDLPPLVIQVVRPRRIEWAQERLDTLLGHISDCERRFGPDAVGVWP